ncbi:plasmid partitioning protein RepB C-terminal domain-containing protein [Reyranella sp.]|uniref:plasmid partitioning protein RepB C-terminal domain-containing protein n=1 Tax=Reyranella sp. TaxID=1929291 RepID=UPI0027216CBC|nr:plasmid partitioning protein RepB C-terminal domain-containing protein [Reyranella sp.]MDO8974318.1 plasmid partitioning protein RepB C-terminal domain-containing protein [Reyranella sp.]
MRAKEKGTVGIGFEETSQRIAIDLIQPLRLVGLGTKKTAKYAQIAASVQEVGLVEPPVVARDRNEPEKFLLLDGHLRVEILKDMGVTAVDCLVSTDDEAFTYNRRVSRIAIIQEHKMILKALERGVSEERLARALNVNVDAIKRKKRLLDGICAEAAELLKDKDIPINSFAELKRMAPLRQIEAAELMIAMNKFTISYAKSLFAATPQDQLADSTRKKSLKGLTDEQVLLMERESARLDREFKMAEQSYGTDHLDLVLARGFLAKLLANARVIRYLSQHHQELLSEFHKVATLESSAA